MTDNQIILSGWKDICEAVGIKSKNTMKKKVRKHRIPVRFLDGRPYISKDSLIRFFDNQK